MTVLEHFEAHERDVAAIVEAESDPLRRSVRLAALAAEVNSDWWEIADDLARAAGLLESRRKSERRTLLRAELKARSIARKASSLRDDMERLLELTSAESESCDGG